MATKVFCTADAMDADFIVIGARRRSRLGRRWLGVGEGVVRGADRPVLTVPPPDGAAASEVRRPAG